MIITNEEDQLRHEEHMRDTFAKKTAGLENVKTRLYEGLEQSDRDSLEEKFNVQSGERPLLACIQTTKIFAIITNQRLIWQEGTLTIKSLTWSDINTINTGTAQQRKSADSLGAHRQLEKTIKWNCIELVDTEGNTHNVEFEFGDVLEWIHWFLIGLHSTYHQQQKGQKDKDAYETHKHCTSNHNEILNSKVCGCFYCLSICSPKDIEDWIDVEGTALCPHCGIDSVIGDKSGYPVTKEFLERMNQFWF